MTEAEFRQKYPHSTEEQVRLYVEAVQAEAEGVRPAVEPDIPMPMVTVPETMVTTYVVPTSFHMRNFSLDDVPPDVEPSNLAVEMRDILLGRYGFNLRLSPETRARIQTTEMTEAELMALLVGAPSAREFAAMR